MCHCTHHVKLSRMQVTAHYCKDTRLHMHKATVGFVCWSAISCRSLSLPKLLRKATGKNCIHHSSRQLPRPCHHAELANMQHARQSSTNTLCNRTTHSQHISSTSLTR
jgi:hypothetical protein